MLMDDFGFRDWRFGCCGVDEMEMVVRGLCGWGFGGSNVLVNDGRPSSRI